MLSILYVFDNNYARYAGISITSFLANNCDAKEEKYWFFCCGMEVSKSNRDRINQIVLNYKQKITWIDSKKSIEYIESCNTGTWNGSKATWMKVFAIWEVPEEVDKLLYIDSDTIVMQGIDDVRAYFEYDFPVAQIPDILGNSYGNKYYNTKEYYNAGIVLFNLNYWRKQDFKTSFLNYLWSNVDKYKDNEQGLLNDFFKGQIYKLPFKYNVQGFTQLYDTSIYTEVYSDVPLSIEEIELGKKEPIIYHFFRIFGDYPWEIGNVHPYKDLFLEWKEKSLWKDEEEKPIKKSVLFSTEKLLYKLLPKKLFLRLYRIVVDNM